MSASVISMSDFEKSAAELDKKTVAGRLPVSVLVHWSESGYFENEALIAFDEFERRAFSAALGHAGRSYLKTKITVNFDDGEQYGCRLDLAARDEIGFADHCRQMIAYAETEDGAHQYEQIGMMSAIEFIRGIAFNFNDPVYADQLKEATEAEEAAKAAAIAQHEKEEADKKAAFAAEVDRIKTAPEFAHLTQYGEYAKDTDIAKNIRADLKKYFPGVKFSVRKNHYNSIDVCWTDGPTAAQVEEITSKYKCGTFDGMTDSSGWDNTPFDQIFGAVRYLWTRREVSEEIKAAARKIVGKKRGVEIISDDQVVNGDQASTLVYREAVKISKTDAGLMYKDDDALISVDEFLTDEPEPAAVEVITVEKPRFKAVLTADGWRVVITVADVVSEYGPIIADSHLAAISSAWELHTEPTDPDDDPNGGEKITRAETLGNYSARIDSRRARAHIRAVKSASESDR